MESSPSVTMTPVTPVRPIAAYIGGKRNLSARLVKLIDAMEHSLVLSINDTSAIQAIFAGFRMEEVAVTYQIGTKP